MKIIRESLMLGLLARGEVGDDRAELAEALREHAWGPATPCAFLSEVRLVVCTRGRAIRIFCAPYAMA